MAPTNQNPWQKRFRRLSYFFGAAGTFYLLSTYALDRMREARVKALKERKERDLLKSHFSTLLSTLSFTLYALLPTLSPQLDIAYPVESTSHALQELSNPASSQISAVVSEDGEGRILDSSVPDIPVHRERSSSGSTRATVEGEGVGESWASEFRGRDEASIGHMETDDELSSATSQPISLPPTDLSASSGSPPSDMMTNSQLLSSPSPPPRHMSVFPAESDGFTGKSKKELWRDLKVQSITRAITTAYLLPLLYILTTSQLSTLARERYLSDVKASLPQPCLPLASPTKPKSGITGLISESASLLRNPFSLMPTFISSRLPWSSAPTVIDPEEEEEALYRAEEKKMEEELQRSEAERMYLTYSWWILHEGWRAVADRVEKGVERVIAPMGLKREISLYDWEGLIQDIRKEVDFDTLTDTAFSFTPHLIPPHPLPRLSSSSEPCPLPISPPSEYLAHLLSQTRSHLASPDASHLIKLGVSTMLTKLTQSLQSDLYDERDRRRLAECLPVFSRWGKGVWEGVPDIGVEGLVGMSEFEGLAGLIFGDWA